MPKIKLTTAAIERLKPNPQPYWDMSHPAFAVRVSKTGVKAFIYAARVHGKVKWATLGRYSELSLAEARGWSKAKMGLDTAAANINDGPSHVGGCTTFGARSRPECRSLGLRCPW